MTWQTILYYLPLLACPLMMVFCFKGMSSCSRGEERAPKDPVQRRAYLEQQLERMDAQRHETEVELAAMSAQPQAQDGSRTMRAPVPVDGAEG